MPVEVVGSLRDDLRVVWGNHRARRNACGGILKCGSQALPRRRSCVNFECGGLLLVCSPWCALLANRPVLMSN